MCRVLTLVCIVCLCSSAYAEKDLSSKIEVQQYVNGQFQAIRAAKNLQEKRKVAAETYKRCFSAPETDDNIEAIANCRAGLRCSGTRFEEFEAKDCDSYIKRCRHYFLGGSGVDPDQKLDTSNGSAEYFGFQILEAMGCKVPAVHLDSKEPTY